MQPKNPSQQYEGVWLGANDIATESNFVWAATGKSVTYTNWKLGQPDNSMDEDCVHLLTESEGRWNDIDCDLPGHKQITMCERITSTGKDLIG